MSQGVIPLTSGGGGSAVRGYINAALARLQTRASGTSRPSDIAAGEPWFETDNPGAGVWSLWRYDGSSDCLLGTFDTSSHVFKSAAAALTGILTTQGDLMYRDGSGVTRLAAASSPYYALFSGGAAANPAWAATWKRLGTANPNSASAVDFTGIPSQINHLMLTGQCKVNTNNVNLLLRTYGPDAALDSGVADYFYSDLSWDNTASSISANTTSSMLLAGSVSSSGDLPVSLQIWAANIQAARYTQFHWRTSFLNQAGVVAVGAVCYGARTESARITGVRIVSSSGTLGTGDDQIELWGAE